MQQLLENENEKKDECLDVEIGKCIRDFNTVEDEEEKLEKLQEQQKERAQASLRAKRDKFFKALKESEQKNKPDRNQSNMFDCQQITVKSPLWGDILVTKEYFLYASFGLETPKTAIYVKKQEVFG